jgi:TPR repeat protein
MPPDLIAMLIARGNALLASGDVTAARLMYSRAADSDSAEGAVAMGMTFDPKMLSQIGVLGPHADPQHAISWYQRAAALGSGEARRLLTRLQGGGDK